jgi:hypothetical protein
MTRSAATGALNWTLLKSIPDHQLEIESRTGLPHNTKKEVS